MKEGWEYKKLGEVCTVLNGFAFKSGKYTDSGTRIMRITNVQKGFIVDDDPKYYPSKEMQDGDYWCGEFDTDETDWRLAELITNIQYACQRYYFGAMAEHYFDNKLKEASVNVRRSTKTLDGFNRLPEVFTTDDVVRCFGVHGSTAYMRISRLTRDGLIEKVEVSEGDDQRKARFRKTNVMMF